MRIGIIGAGQLGKMLALAGYKLGFSFVFYDPNKDSPALNLGKSFVSEYTDTNKLLEFAHECDVITYEFENIPAQALKALEKTGKLFPSTKALEISQDRLTEKEHLQSLNIPTASFSKVNNKDDLLKAVETLGFPLILKTRTLGYDGKGQVVIEKDEDIYKAEQLLSVPCIAEKKMAFNRELSLIAVRGKDKSTAFYPLAENIHNEGILFTSISPADNSKQIQKQAQNIAKKLFKSLKYVGVLAIELFQCGEQLLVNEIAPRVHNTGHWSIEGALTSQFENHIRAITGLPLGDTRIKGKAGMVNIIGAVPDIETILKLKGVNLHMYGKAPRPGRKIGHVNFASSSSKIFGEQFSKILAIIPGVTIE